MARTTGFAPVHGLAGTGPGLVSLLNRVAARDREAFAALYRATCAKLYGIVLRILQRRDIADEVLQETYVQIWEKAALFDASKGSPITWMAAIARNRALDEVRRKPALPLDDTSEALNVASGESSALERMEQSEELQRLWRCLQHLDEERREMVLLAYRDGMSREALGARLSRPTATIKTWLRRSLAQLRECLGR